MHVRRRLWFPATGAWRSRRAHERLRGSERACEACEQPSAVPEARRVPLHACGACASEVARTSAARPPALGSFRPLPPWAPPTDLLRDKIGREGTASPMRRGPPGPQPPKVGAGALTLAVASSPTFPLPPVLSRTPGKRGDVCRRAGALRGPLGPPQARPIRMWSICRTLCLKKRFIPPPTLAKRNGCSVTRRACSPGGHFCVALSPSSTGSTQGTCGCGASAGELGG